MRSLFNMANGYMLKFQRGESLIICLGNSMICGDIWHKYYEWYFKIVKHNFTSG